MSFSPGFIWGAATAAYSSAPHLWSRWSANFLIHVDCSPSLAQMKCKFSIQVFKAQEGSEGVAEADLLRRRAYSAGGMFPSEL